MDFEVLRKRMVKEQLESRGIDDPGVLSVMSCILRHEFIPTEYLGNAYADYPLSIGEGQTISQPFMVALMTQSLNLTGKEKVLEIGTGSGYQAAILAKLSKEVYSVERIKSLADAADARLKNMGVENVKIKVGDGTLGWEEFAPYDRIIVTAAAPQVSPALIEQLKDGGFLLIPLGGTLSQMLTCLCKQGKKIESEDICACVFVPLVGQYGWKERED
jgi:protein-L-isoaspartate(D-aspartate) O-methyltransferase